MDDVTVMEGAKSLSYITQVLHDEPDGWADLIEHHRLEHVSAESLLVDGDKTLVKMIQRGRGLLPREVLSELISVHVEVLDQGVDVLYVILEIVFLILNTLVPNHRQQSLYIGLRHLGILVHV